MVFSSNNQTIDLYGVEFSGNRKTTIAWFEEKMEINMSSCSRLSLQARPWKVRASLLLCAALSALAVPAAAQTYPTKPVRVIVPYGPGTAPDSIARIASDGLQRRLGQSFVVETRTGAGGKIGTEAAALAAPDGYTLFLGTKDSQSILAHLYPTWNIKPDRSLVPISGLARIENVLVTRSAFPANSLQDMVALAKTKELTYGTPGVGTNLHLMGELLRSRQGLKLLHVPYSRSFAEALPAVVRGDVDLLVAGLPPMLPFLQDGRAKALAITGTARSRYLPDVPTFSELGIKDLETGGWFGFFAPAGTPAAILSKLEAELALVVKSPEFRSRMETMSAEPWPATPADVSRTIEAETRRWGALIQESRITVN